MSDGVDVVVTLHALATYAESANHWTDDKRMMDASGVADTIYEAMDRIEELEAKLRWVLEERDATFALMLKRAETAEANLAKAVEALEKLDVGEGWAAQIARTTLAELTGGKDAE